MIEAFDVWSETAYTKPRCPKGRTIGYLARGACLGGVFFLKKFVQQKVQEKSVFKGATIS